MTHARRVAFQEDRAWSERLLVPIKRILGEHLFGTAPLEEDRERNTDLIVVCSPTARVACRVRRNRYWQRADYRGQFTIRSERPLTGNRTELDKIVEGWGNYFLYGFANEAGTDLIHWTLADLYAFRRWLAAFLLSARELPGVEMSNYDGSSSFRVFAWSELPEEIVVASHWIAPADGLPF